MGMSDLANISIGIDGQLEKMIPAKVGCNVCTSNHDIQYFPNQIHIISHIIMTKTTLFIIRFYYT